ncbi:MAG TPA: ATP synthase F0 subunit B [Patescibacteria group bacterium]|nr:ATP synthase F0 subunit B [Patescibacteria group bacterium]
MKRLRLPVTVLLVACGLVLLAAHPVSAAEEGGEPSRLSSVFQWLNFAIVAGLLMWVLVRKAPAYFAERARQIVSAIREAGKAKEQADAQRREAEQRLANLSREIEAMRATALRDAEAEVARIRAAAGQEAAKIEAAAHMEVDAAARSARIELRALATRLSIENAEALLRVQITPAAEDGMFATFLGELAHPGKPTRAGGQTGRPN